MVRPLQLLPGRGRRHRRLGSLGMIGGRDALVGLLGAVMVFVAAVPVLAQSSYRGGCIDPSEFLRTRATVERAGLAGPERARLVRILRAAQTLASEGCPARDPWLVRRSVGMLNAVNREVRRPPVELPMFLRD